MTPSAHPIYHAHECVRVCACVYVCVRVCVCVCVRVWVYVCEREGSAQYRLHVPIRPIVQMGVCVCEREREREREGEREMNGIDSKCASDLSIRNQMCVCVCSCVCICVCPSERITCSID